MSIYKMCKKYLSTCKFLISIYAILSILSSFVSILLPVSYTHLDVYKRQIQAAGLYSGHTYVNRFGIAASGGVDLSPYSKKTKRIITAVTTVN